MMKITNSLLLIGILLNVNVSVAHAADLRGKLTGLPGARVIVTCGDNKRWESKLPKSGTYNVTRLPANKPCTFIVAYRNTASTIIRFSTKNSVTTFNGKLKLFGQRILVTKQSNRR